MVHDEVEGAALDVAAALRSVRRGQRHARPGPTHAGAEPLMTLPRLALALLGVGLVSPGRPAPGPRLDPGHPHLSRRIGPRQPVLSPRRRWPTCCGPFPSTFSTATSRPTRSIAKHYAPLGRHCHYWHVGQEIHDLAATDALRAFGLGYLSHLAADTIAHNYFVPRQLMLTSSTAAVGHSYWETRVEAHLGDAYAKVAKDVILLDHAPADAHLDRIIAPDDFQRAHQPPTVPRHGAPHRDHQLAAGQPGGAGVQPLAADRCRRGASPRALVRLHDGAAGRVGRRRPATSIPRASGRSRRPRRCAAGCIREAGRRDTAELQNAANEHFGLPDRALVFWSQDLQEAALARA